MAGTKQFNEDEALDRAMSVFWQRGYPTSMQDLAQATGVLRGSLYHAYGDKRAIFLRTFARCQERFLDAARTVLSAASPDEAVRQFFHYAIASMTQTESSDATRGCLSTKTATDETAMDEPIRLALRGLLDGLRHLLEERLSTPDAQARLTLPAPAAATLAVTLTRGMVVMERVYHDPAQLQAIGDDLVRLLLPAQP